MKPTLAYTVKGDVSFPVMASPKLDGIRCLIVNGKAVSRTGKLIPNRHVQESISQLEGFDGELIVGDETDSKVFQTTTSGVMSRDGKPGFKFWVFDKWDESGGFTERLAKIDRAFRVDHVQLSCARDLDEYESRMVAKGFEGVMIRKPDGTYKQGRSTETDGILGKVKRFTDCEAVIVESVEHLHGGKLGAFNVQSAGFSPFSVGTGFTEWQRERFWHDRVKLVGSIVKVKYQAIGSGNAPRFPVFAGFRLD